MSDPAGPPETPPEDPTVTVDPVEAGDCDDPDDRVDVVDAVEVGEVAGGPTPVATRLLAKRLPMLMALMRSKVTRTAFLLAVLALLAVTLQRQGSTLWNQVQRLSAPVLLAALVGSFAALVCSMMVWRSLLADLGSKLSFGESWRINYIGQLGKYIPGSIWPVLAQTELGADSGVPRNRSVVSALLCFSVVICTGGVVAAVTLPFAAAGWFGRYFWALFVVPLVLVVLSPPVLNRVFAALLRVLRRSPLQRGLSVRGLSRAMVWAVAGWVCNGIMTYVLMRQLAGDSRGTFLVSVGGYALAWVVGFVAVFAPAGAGVREAVMVAVLSSHTTAAIALTVALVTRALGVVADAVTGLAAAALVGRRRLQRFRAEARDRGFPAAET